MSTENASLPIPKFHMPQEGGSAESPVVISGTVIDAQVNDYVEVMTAGGQYLLFRHPVVSGTWLGMSGVDLPKGEVLVTVRLVRRNEYSSWAPNLKFTVK